MQNDDVKRNRAKIKELFRGYRHMTRSIRQGLYNLGFRVKIGRKHIKIYYGNNQTKPFIVSVSASDHRSGLNIARQLASVWKAA